MNKYTIEIISDPAGVFWTASYCDDIYRRIFSGDVKMTPDEAILDLLSQIWRNNAWIIDNGAEQQIPDKENAMTRPTISPVGTAAMVRNLREEGQNSRADYLEAMQARVEELEDLEAVAPADVRRLAKQLERVYRRGDNPGDWRRHINEAALIIGKIGQRGK